MFGKFAAVFSLPGTEKVFEGIPDHAPSPELLGGTGGSEVARRPVILGKAYR